MVCGCVCSVRVLKCHSVAALDCDLSSICSLAYLCLYQPSMACRNASRSVHTWLVANHALSRLVAADSTADSTTCCRCTTGPGLVGGVGVQILGRNGCQGAYVCTVSASTRNGWCRIVRHCRSMAEGPWCACANWSVVAVCWAGSLHGRSVGSVPLPSHRLFFISLLSFSSWVLLLGRHPAHSEAACCSISSCVETSSSQPLPVPGSAQTYICCCAHRRPC